MNSQVSLKDLGNDIKRIYISDPSRAETLIEGYLEERLKELSPSERLSILDELFSKFKFISPHVSNASNIDPELLVKLYTLLLGEGISEVDFSSEETMVKLTQSLNTIFDKLNQLIRIIHTTLLGKTPEFETIRHIIGAELEGASPSISLENYLDQIQKAFLSAHEAFKKAAYTKIQEILIELDPDLIANNVETGLKFGPLRKAEYFKVYQEKFQKFKKWLESGRFTEALLREFEKNCQKLYLEKRGEI